MGLGSRVHARALYRDPVVLVVLTIATVALVYAVVPRPSLTRIVAMLELVSLLSLIAVNGSVSASINKDDPLARHANQVILVVTTVICLLKLLDVLDVVIRQSADRQWFIGLFDLLERNSYWISAFPLVAYFLLDLLYAADRRQANREAAATARSFLVFVDFTCVLPFLLVLVLVWIHQVITPSAAASTKLFVSGSMAVVLFASSVAAKAVDRVFVRGQ